MRRKSLLLLLFVPLLLLLFTIAGVQALASIQFERSAAASLAAPESAPAQEPIDPTDVPLGEPEADVVEAPDEGVPLNPPLSIRIRQTIPLTVALNLLRPITTTLSPTNTLLFTGLVPVTDTLPATTTLDLGASLDDRAGSTEAADLGVEPVVTVSVPITGATIITGLLPLTDVAPLAGPLAITGSVELTGSLPVTLGVPLTDVVAIPSLTFDLPADTTPDALASVTGSVPITAPALLLTTDGLTDVPPIFTGVGITMDLDLQILITDTLTSTVPARLVLRFSGMPALTVPVSITVNAPPTATVVVEPADVATAPFDVTGEITDAVGITLTDVITLSPPLTETEAPVDTPPLTPTGPPDLVAVTVTVPVTTNVRLAPSIDAEIVRRALPGEVLEVVAINATSEWLLLREGNWVAVIAIGVAPAGLLPASDDLVVALRTEFALQPTPTPTPIPPTPEPTPTPEPLGPVPGTATVNANLRSGPGTTFNIVGQTQPGQALIIIARSADNGWFLLDTGSWISVPLVAGTPPIEQIPVFDPNAPPTPTPEPVLEPTPEITGTVPITVTPPGADTPTVLPTATPRPAALTVDENIYLIEFDTISATYERALSAVDRLVDSASDNPAVFQDPQWITDMNTAIQLIRNAGADVTQQAVPERFVAAHNSLTTAATQYSNAADLLAQGVRDAAPAAFEQAFAAVTLGDASIAQASAALSSFRP
jgi:hypothetical protein